MSHLMRVSCAALLVILALLPLAVTSNAAGKPIKIGAVLPLSGYFALEGTTEKKAAQVVVDEVNAKGGLLGRPVELLVEDGRADPTESVSAARKLVTKDGVRAIIGALASSATLAIMPIADRYGVPLLVETSTAAKITAMGNPWVFRISTTNDLDAKALAPHITKELGFNKVAFLPANNDWGRSVAEAYGEIIKKQGGEVVAVEYYQGGETNFAPMLTKIKGVGATSLIITADSNTIATINKQLHSQGMGDLRRMTTGGFPAAQILQMAGPQVTEGLYSVSALPSQPPADIASRLSSFLALYAKHHPSDKVNANVIQGHDGIAILLEAIKAAGSDEPGEIRDALKKITYKGLTGTLKFDARGQAHPNVYVEQIKDGKVRTLFTLTQQ